MYVYGNAIEIPTPSDLTDTLNTYAGLDEIPENQYVYLQATLETNDNNAIAAIVHEDDEDILNGPIGYVPGPVVRAGQLALMGPFRSDDLKNLKIVTGDVSSVVVRPIWGAVVNQLDEFGRPTVPTQAAAMFIQSANELSTQITLTELSAYYAYGGVGGGLP